MGHFYDIPTYIFEVNGRFMAVNAHQNDSLYRARLSIGNDKIRFHKHKKMK